MRWNVACASVVVVLWSAAAPAFARDAGDGIRILIPRDASKIEQLAAREVRRYVYLRCGAALPVTAAAVAPAEAGSCIIVARGDRPIVLDATDDADVRRTIASLRPQHHLLKTIGGGGSQRLLVVGGDDAGTLYAAYRFAEHLGVRFGLDEDVLPDARVELKLPRLDELSRPAFELRGIQPFHDFPEGPDWWSTEHYRAVISQLPKLRMNFFGLHTYPEGGVGPEPAVWIGMPGDVAEGAAVRRSYPSSWMNTLRGTWGYAPRRTREYAFGASQLFDRDEYGPDVMRGHAPLPTTPQACNDVFGRAGESLRESFSHARALGVKTCVGTETPLVVPRAVLDRLPKTASSWLTVLGGGTARDPSPIARTEDDALYQTVRWNLTGYDLAVPDGAYTVTLKFSEVAYDARGARVFGVSLQGHRVIEKLDVFAEVGKHAALDRVFRDVAVTNGRLEVRFHPLVEFPCVAGIVVEGPNFTGKIDSAGPGHGDYVPDEPTITPEQVTKLYEGTFRRIKQTYPIDYYWLWTPEDWTWRGATDAQVRATVDDLHAAVAAARNVDAPFTLATCGWVLGPPGDRALFDNVLPKEMPLSCINRAVGKDPVEPGFADVNGRPKWAIPWLEDDPNLLSPQLWAGRMRRDAADAHAYGCTGLMGIHWRTRVVGPNVAALAQAAWEVPSPRPASRGRHLPSDDFYRDWTAAQFGPEAAAKIAGIFAKLDGRLPEPSTWTNGPGGLAPDPKPWQNALQLYAFVDELASLRPRIRGKGSLERFDYWLNSFRYARATERVKACWADYDAALKSVTEERDAPVRRSRAERSLLPLRRELIVAVGEAYNLLLATVNTPGELGTIANWEQHVFPTLIDEPGKQLASLLGRELPADAVLPRRYAGPTRVIVPTARTSVAANEPLELQVLVLSGTAPTDATLNWRVVEEGAPFVSLPLQRVARGVYRACIPAQPSDVLAIEYRIEVAAPDGRAVFPPAAPELHQTVVVAP